MSRAYAGGRPPEGPLRQTSLFDSQAALDLVDADVVYQPVFLSVADADRLLGELTDAVAWRQDHITMYGRRVAVPRLNAWYGDPGAGYTYSNLQLEPERWIAPLVEIKTVVETACGTNFNSVLVNLYRDGSDSVSWHADDEPELGPAPTIASVSLGATRRFHLRHNDGEGRAVVDLEHGSLLVMRGPTQQRWQHQVPKTKRAVGPRINLTFRTITT